MSILIDILKELPLSAVLREKLLALEKDMSALQTENKVLKAELADCKKEKTILENKIKQIEKDNEPPEDWGDIQPV